VAVLATLARIGAVSWLRLCTIRLAQARRAVVRQAWGYGIWSFLNGLAGQLGFATTDMLIISRVLGVSSVAIYSVVIAPVTLATDLVYRAVDVFQPTITAIAYRQGGKADDVGRALLTLMKAVITIGWCLTLMLCLAGKEFLDLWVGSVDDVAGPLMVVFALGFGSLHVGHVCGLVLLGVARHRILGAMAIADGLANVGLSALLATQYGLLGIAWGTLISQSISNLLVIPLYACRVTKLPIREYAFLLVRAVPLFAASMAIGRLVDTLDLGYFQTVVLRCLIAGVIFLAGCWLLVFSAADREAVVSEAGRFLRRGRAGPAEGRLGAMAAE
jgi:O-antigen/teichoic acid export membrane protein